MTATRFFESPRLGTPTQSILSLKTAGHSTWFRSLLSKVFLLSYKRGLVYTRKGETGLGLTHVRVPQPCHPLFTLLATKFGRTCRKWKGKSLAILLTYTMFRQNLDCEQSLFFSQSQSQSQIALFLPLSPQKITTARSLDKIMCINKVTFCFQPGLCCFS